MIIDGNAIAEDLYARMREEIRALSFVPKCTIITCAPTFETKKYLALKQKKARAVGIETHVVEVSATSATEEIIALITEEIPKTTSMIVQLPLPAHIDRDLVLAAVPPSHDADALNPATQDLYSPVVGALREILGRHAVRIPESFVTIIGNGQLVGLPAYHWFIDQGAHVSVVTKDTEHIAQYTKQADIVVCGAGVPHLVTKDMVKDGVIILDAGTSEDGGELRGDVDNAVAEKAALFTPVPGGIGPITVAILLKNVLQCAQRAHSVV